VGARLAAVGRLWGAAGGEVPPGADLPSYQVQVFMESYAPLTQDDLRQAQEFFRQVWSILRSRCAGAREGSR
jgi:hypothetical protein